MEFFSEDGRNCVPLESRILDSGELMQLILLSTPVSEAPLLTPTWPIGKPKTLADHEGLRADAENQSNRRSE